MTRLAELGDFLRARRAALDPAEMGLPPVANERKVPGLRREEAAQLAGISADYYTRLEQGRVRSVSTQVLEALARGFNLTADETRYLRNLVSPPRPPAGRAGRQRVRPALARLVDGLGRPAVVYGRYTEILAWNALGGALYLDLDASGPENVSGIRRLLFDDRFREAFPEFEKVVRDMVGNLRAEAGRYPDDPVLAQLVGEMTMRSRLFGKLWNDQTVREHSHGSKTFRNPVVGELVLHFETLRLPDDPDQMVVVYDAEPGSPSAEKLALLASWMPETRETHREPRNARG
jgi:transcriptional regulator with XRE-family HTH domain